MTALHWAAERGDAALAEMLLLRRRERRAPSRASGTTRRCTWPAAPAARRSCKALLKAGADAHARRPIPSGVTPLHLAAEAGNVDASTALLDTGADVNATEAEWDADAADLRGRGQSRRRDHAARHARREGQLETQGRRSAEAAGAGSAGDDACSGSVLAASVPKGAEPDAEPAAGRDSGHPRVLRDRQGAGAADRGAAAAGGGAVAAGGGGARAARCRRRSAARAGARGAPARMPTPRAGAGRSGAAALDATGGARCGSDRHGRRRRPIALNAGWPGAVDLRPRAVSRRCITRRGRATSQAAAALLEAGAERRIRRPATATAPLLVALINGQFDVAMMLVKRGANPNQACRRHGVTPLWATVNAQWQPRTRFPQPQEMDLQKATYLDVMKALLDKGADPNARIRVASVVHGLHGLRQRQLRPREHASARRRSGARRTARTSTR